MNYVKELKEEFLKMDKDHQEGMIKGVELMRRNAIKNQNVIKDIFNDHNDEEKLKPEFHKIITYLFEEFTKKQFKPYFDLYNEAFEKELEESAEFIEWSKKINV